MGRSGLIGRVAVWCFVAGFIFAGCGEDPVEFEINPAGDIPIEKRCNTESHDCFGEANTEEWLDFVERLGPAMAITRSERLDSLARFPDESSASQLVIEARSAQGLSPLPSPEDATDSEAEEAARFALSVLAAEWPTIFQLTEEALNNELRIDRVRRTLSGLTLDTTQVVATMRVVGGSPQIEFDDNWIPVAITRWMEPTQVVEDWLDSVGGLPSQQSAWDALEEYIVQELGTTLDADRVVSFEPAWMVNRSVGGYWAVVENYGIPGSIDYFLVSPVSQ